MIGTTGDPTMPPEIREARAADAEALNAIYNHYVMETPATFDIAPTTIEDRRAWLADFRRSGPHRLVVAEQAGELLGYACTRTFKPKAAYATSVETSIYLAEGARGAGLGTRLYQALFELVSGESVHRAYAGITMPNPASVSLHRRFGFESIGVFHEAGHKFDRFWSVEWFEKRLS